MYSNLFCVFDLLICIYLLFIYLIILSADVRWLSQCKIFSLLKSLYRCTDEFPLVSFLCTVKHLRSTLVLYHREINNWRLVDCLPWFIRQQFWLKLLKERCLFNYIILSEVFVLCGLKDMTANFLCLLHFGRYCFFKSHLSTKYIPNITGATSDLCKLNQSEEDAVTRRVMTAKGPYKTHVGVGDHHGFTICSHF